MHRNIFTLMSMLYSKINLSTTLFELFVCLLFVTQGHHGLRDSGQYTVGSYTFDYTVDYSETIKDFEIEKSSLKFSLTSKLIDEPIFQVKQNRLIDLVRCDKINVKKPEFKQLIDCRTIEYLNETGISDYVPLKLANHDRVERIVLQLKSTFAYREQLKRSFKRSFVFYKLKDAHTTERVDSILLENNQTGRIIGPNAETIGFYSEVSLDFPQKTKCTGTVFASMVPMGHTKLDFDVSAAIAALSKGNFLLSVKDLACYVDDQPESVLRNNFTIIKRTEFPYWTCHHSIQMEQLDYRGSIIQQKNQNEDSYMTRIQMDSKSIFDRFKFKLDQVFNSFNSSSGFEEMIFTNPYITALVTGEWSTDKLIKTIQLISGKILSEKSLEPSLVLKYLDEPDEEYITVVLMVKRSMVNNGRSKTSNADDAPESRDDL